MHKTEPILTGTHYCTRSLQHSVIIASGRPGRRNCVCDRWFWCVGLCSTFAQVWVACAECQGSAEMLSAHFLTLDRYRSWKNNPRFFFFFPADLTVWWSLHLSCTCPTSEATELFEEVQSLYPSSWSKNTWQQCCLTQLYRQNFLNTNGSQASH